MTKKLKCITQLISVVILALFALSASAEDKKHENKNEKKAAEKNEPDPNFENHKKALLTEYDGKILNINAAKTCVTAAKNQADMNACHDQYEKSQKELNEKVKKIHDENKRIMLDGQIKKLEEEKAKLNKK